MTERFMQELERVAQAEDPPAAFRQSIVDAVLEDHPAASRETVEEMLSWAGA